MVSEIICWVWIIFTSWDLWYQQGVCLPPRSVGCVWIDKSWRFCWYSQQLFYMHSYLKASLGILGSIFLFLEIPVLLKDNKKQGLYRLFKIMLPSQPRTNSLSAVFLKESNVSISLLCWWFIFNIISTVLGLLKCTARSREAGVGLAPREVRSEGGKQAKKCN